MVGHNATICRRANKPETDRQHKMQIAVENVDAVDKDAKKQPIDVQQQKKKWITKDMAVLDLEIEEGDINVSL